MASASRSTRVEGRDFWINLIPHTVAVTNLKHLAPGSKVNLEIDLIATRASSACSSGRTTPRRPDPRAPTQHKGSSMSALAPITDIIADIKAGGWSSWSMEDRENGATSMAAEVVTPRRSTSWPSTAAG